MKKLLCAIALLLALPALPETNDLPQYKTGFRMVLKLGSELYDTLPPASQKQIHPSPISVEAMDAPIMTPVEGSDDDKSLHQVCISAGFIDLMNHVAHAKAIDRIEKGYFEKYVQMLGAIATNDPVPELPNLRDPRYWTDDVMNDQLSSFNQMVGMTVAINLSHHYLGHYTKYVAQLPAGKLAPINNLLTSSEWDTCFKAAALNSLNCALGTDGIKALFEAIDKMPKRPSWTAYIVPVTADLKKLTKQMAKYETDFFKGGLK